MSEGTKWAVGIVIAIIGIIVPVIISCIDNIDQLEEVVKLEEADINNLRQDLLDLVELRKEADKEIYYANEKIGTIEENINAYRYYFKVSDEEEFYLSWKSKISQLASLLSNENKITDSHFKSVGMNPYEIEPRIIGITSDKIEDQNLSLADYIHNRDILNSVNKSIDDKLESIGRSVIKLKDYFYYEGRYRVEREKKGVEYLEVSWPTKEELNEEVNKLQQQQDVIRAAKGKMDELSLKITSVENSITSKKSKIDNAKQQIEDSLCNFANK